LNSGLILPICRKMMFVSYIHVLSAAFLMGLAAAAPMGPVNMLAIRRGVIGGWRHTLACGIGSITGDLMLFSLVLLGGHYFFSDLSNPTLQTVLAAIGVIVLLPLGIYFLVRAIKDPCAPSPAPANDGTKLLSPPIWSPKSPTLLL
jgi:threonine/homoserine/homoserine lactone efflux protein